MDLSQTVLTRIKEWTKPPYSNECVNEIEQLVSSDNYKEINERFAVDLEFGTGGLRGIIGWGTNRMNIYTVMKATQGLSNHLKQSFSGKKLSAVVSYDCRRLSTEFAKATASVFAANGIKVYIFKKMRPTPMLSYAIRKLGCDTGVIITASHNPKEYNGYKAYWNDGAQVTEPHDRLIIDEVRKINSMDMVLTGDFETYISRGTINYIDKDLDVDFFNDIRSLVINRDLIKSNKKDIKIVYTPLHGTGSLVMPDCFLNAGFEELICVDEQMVADSEFSTVIYPNPEEKEALSLAVKKAKSIKADIVIATDPDADRVGIAVMDRSGEMVLLNGNQTGAILIYYILSQKKRLGLLPANSAIIKTIVTTPLQDKIAESFGVKVFNVLTGFKYIATKQKHFEEDKNYIFQYGGEESYGYCTGNFVRDKDSLGASVMIAEAALLLKSQGRNLIDYLDEIYKKYGYYEDSLQSRTIKGLEGKEVIDRIMTTFRKNRPAKINGVSIIRSIDFENEDIQDSEGSRYILPKSNVLQYYFEDGSRITFRPSGTEPKIKFYFTTKGENSESLKVKVKDFERELMSIVDSIIS